MAKLNGKVAVVTGGSKGIGAEIASHIASKGAAVAINYSSSKEDAEKLVSEISKKGGKAIAVKANITHQNELEHLFSETIKAFGKLDILVNNAGIYEFASIEEITPESFHKMFDLNVLALLLATKEAVKHFKNGGSIINISSVASSAAPPNSAIYSGTKGAVDTITKVLAKELGPRKIRVNAVNPGMIITHGTLEGGIIASEFRKTFESHTPLGRIGETKDVAPAVIFLASDESSWITGETLVISGGFH